MQELLDWTLNTIREEDSSFSWMEEYRYEWTPLVQSAVSKIIDGKTGLLLTDDTSRWFEQYVLCRVNDISKDRPFLPLYSLLKSFPHLEVMKSTDELELLEDMLDISYPQGYYFWYIGKGGHPYTKLAYRNEESFLWVIDQEVQNSFSLKSDDPLLDVKLIQLYKLFDKTLFATLFGELDLEL